MGIQRPILIASKSFAQILPVRVGGNLFRRLRTVIAHGAKFALVHFSSLSAPFTALDYPAASPLRWQSSSLVAFPFIGFRPSRPRWPPATVRMTGFSQGRTSAF